MSFMRIEEKQKFMNKRPSVVAHRNQIYGYFHDKKLMTHSKNSYVTKYDYPRAPTLSMFFKNTSDPTDILKNVSDMDKKYLA